MKTKILFIFIILLAATAQADIQDRINDCENKGGGKCLYNLLRELAQNQNGGGQPKKIVKIETYNGLTCSGQLRSTTLMGLDLSGDLDKESEKICDKAETHTDIVSISIDGVCHDHPDFSSAFDYLRRCKLKVMETLAQ